jgi:hypothetical protein
MATEVTWEFREFPLPAEGRLLTLHRLQVEGWELVGIHTKRGGLGSRLVAVVRRRRTADLAEPAARGASEP